MQLDNLIILISSEYKAIRKYATGTNCFNSVRTTENQCGRDQKSGVIGKHRSCGIEWVHGSSPRGFDQKENLLKVFSMKNVRKSDWKCWQQEQVQIQKRLVGVVVNTNPPAHPNGESPLAD